MSSIWQFAFNWGRMVLWIILISVTTKSWAADCPGITQSQDILVAHCQPVAPDDMIAKLLRVVVGPSQKPLRVAVIAGITEYPAIRHDQAGEIVKKDLTLLQGLFVDTLGYDLVIVIRSEGVNRATLNRLFGVELPVLLKERTGSQVVFAFSGHGAQFGPESYILTTKSPRLKFSGGEDVDNAISLSEIRQIVAPSVRASFQFLLLLNSCYGGALLRERLPFGEPIYSVASAQGITAGREQDLVYGLEVNRGSVLFEYFAEIVKGAAGDKATQLSSDSQRVGEDGIVTLTEISGLLKPAVERLENYRVSPQVGVLTEGRNEGDYFFVVDQVKADEALRRSRFRPYRQVMGEEKAGLPPFAIQIRNDLSPAGAVEVGSLADWRLFRLTREDGSSACYVESEGVASLNDLLEITRPREPFEGGKFSKLRYLPAQMGVDKDDVGFWYIMSDDVQHLVPSITQLNFHFLENLAIWQRQIDVRYPYALRTEGLGIRLTAEVDDIEASGISGTYVTVTGYRDIEPLPITPAIEAMQPATRRFIFEKLLGIFRVGDAFGFSRFVAENPVQLADIVKYDEVAEPAREAFEEQSVSADDWIRSARSLNAAYQALPASEHRIIESMTAEDWNVFVSAGGYRDVVFSDSISLIGFTKILNFFHTRC